MCEIKHLNVAEAVKVDPDRIVELCVALGENGAEALVMRSITDLSDGMNRIDRYYFADRWQDMVAEARKLQKISDHIGMTTMHRVLGDVIACLEIDDETPLAATMTRLRRITDKSLNAALAMRDMPA